MPTQLKLTLNPGETLTYRNSMTSVFKDEAGERSEKQMQFLVATQVDRVVGEVMHCRSQTTITEAEGIEAASTEPGPWLAFSQDATGKVLASQDPKAPVRATVSLPRIPVDVDDAWEVTEQASPEADPVVLEFHLESLEERDGEQVAVIGCGGDMVLDEGAAQAFIEGTIHFSVTRGRKLWSRILFSMTWESGRKVDSTEESTLL